MIKVGKRRYSLLFSYMKKLFLFTIIFLFIYSILSADWTISTSQGDKTLVIPEGMTLEEAYQQMAVMYWEERYDREELQATVEDLTIKSEEYIEANTALRESNDSLIQNYADLTDLYEEKLKTPWVKGLLSVDLGWGIPDNRFNGTLYGGVLIKERVTLEAGLSYLWELHLKAGIIF